jgi:Ca2+-binding EF-hand superfamily protein
MFPMTIYRALALVTILGIAASAPALAGQAQPRQRSMDADGDGVITRAEWRGTAEGFRQQDTNHDGVLSGNEVRAVTWQNPRATGEATGRREAPETRVAAMDTDRDGVITRAEWRGTDEGFRQQDTNRDRVLSGDEVRAVALQDPPATQAVAGRFAGMDTDRDGVITRAEWRGNTRAFRQQDTNRDGVLSGNEVGAVALETAEETRSREAISARFNRADRNGDGRIARDEWTGNDDLFKRIDRNGDGTVTRQEFTDSATDLATATSGERLPAPAYQAGYDKGIAEGRQAGKADRTVNAANGGTWDLEGQTELEQADSGYNARLGPRNEYQAGYRVGFRLGYTEGFGPRNTESPAYKAGHERGIAEGRQAGKADRTVNAANGGTWDLEGQTELEQADSGYNARLGPRNEYQAGYRAGFRLGYQEGFGPR